VQVELVETPLVLLETLVVAVVAAEELFFSYREFVQELVQSHVRAELVELALELARLERLVLSVKFINRSVN